MIGVSGPSVQTMKYVVVANLAPADRLRDE